MKPPAQLLAALLAFTGVAFSPMTSLDAQAREIKEITSSHGIRAWLVEERGVPLVAIRFAVLGGSTQDPVGKEGLTSFLLAMLQEGAGELSSRAFKEAVQATAAQLSFSSARDRTSGGIVTLEKNLAQSTDLLRIALLSPRFEDAAIVRVRQQLVARLAINSNDPATQALDNWYRVAFAGHAYSRPATGTAAGLAGIGRDDLVAHHKRLLARERLRVVLVGNISEAGAVALLDKTFGALPAAGAIADVPMTEPTPQGQRSVIEREQPLSAAVFGLPAIPSTDPDHAAALVLNHIMGSGDFDARLVEEARVKRGLVYSIRTSLVSDTTIALMLGQFTTRNEALAEVLGVIDHELKRMAASGARADEVDNAKSYLTGSFLLGFDGSASLADALLGVWLDGHGPTEFERRRQAIARVTVNDVSRVATRLLRPERMTISIVGKPVLGK